MLIYQATITIILALLLLNTLNNLRLLRRPEILMPDPSPPRRRPELDDSPLVSILVPARNEERAIGRCVESLALQDYPRCEILVLDDHSEDRTAAIVAELSMRYPRVRLLHGEPLPWGWHGKAFACAQLAREAKGDWLLFADADTVHASSCVSTTVTIAQQRRVAAHDDPTAGRRQLWRGPAAAHGAHHLRRGPAAGPGNELPVADSRRGVRTVHALPSRGL